MTPGNLSFNRSNQSDPFTSSVLDSIGIIGNRTPRRNLLADVNCLTSKPLGWYEEHVHWPTGMGNHGIPVEFSVSFKNGEPNVRLLSDPQDHRFRLAGNWRNYVSSAAKIIGTSEARVLQMMVRHLDINPPNTLTPIYFGIRYGRRKRHSSLYLSTVSWPKGLVQKRIPTSADISELTMKGLNAPWVHLVGYDFDDASEIYRTKLYAWIDRDAPLHNLSKTITNAPGLTHAQALLDHLKKKHRIDMIQQSTLVQFSQLTGQPSWSRKLYLHAPKWRFDNACGLGDLIRYVARFVDISKLMDIFQSFSKHHILLLPTGFSMELSTRVPTTVTFYFATAPNIALCSVTPTRLRSLYQKSAKAILLQMKQEWPAIPAWERPAALSRIQLALSSQPAIRPILGKFYVAEAASAKRDGSYAVYLARETLTRVHLKCPVYREAISGERLVGDSLPETVALRLLAELGSKDCCRAEVFRAVESLVSQERWSGGWIGPGDELTTTVTVLEAFVRAMGKFRSLEGQLVPALRRTVYWLRALPVPKEAVRVALWIKGNVLVGDTYSKVSVDRGLAFLAYSQQQNGTWLPSPFESASGDCAYLDTHGWASTAIVSEVLARFV